MEGWAGAAEGHEARRTAEVVCGRGGGRRGERVAGRRARGTARGAQLVHVRYEYKTSKLQVSWTQ